MGLLWSGVTVDRTRVTVAMGTVNGFTVVKITVALGEIKEP